MDTGLFSQWKKWVNRNEIDDIKMPGIYAIAISAHDIEGTPFDYVKEIVYFGMTNSKGGLKSRLRAFNNTINDKTGHGGAVRFRFKHIDKKVLEDDDSDRDILKESLLNNIYVAVTPFKCDVTTHAPNDLRVMGEVAKMEYECFAKYVELFGELSEFNNMQKSPKN